jgi:antitoxin (DNA-binding transcriptional repressor) of toxin-antitoxin stability system
MRTVTTYNFRKNLADLLDEVSSEETTITILRSGKPIALVSPITEKNYPKIEDFYGFLGNGDGGETFLSKVRRSKKEASHLKNLYKM